MILNTDNVYCILRALQNSVNKNFSITDSGNLIFDAKSCGHLFIIKPSVHQELTPIYCIELSNRVPRTQTLSPRSHHSYYYILALIRVKASFFFSKNATKYYSKKGEKNDGGGGGERERAVGGFRVQSDVRVRVPRSDVLRELPFAIHHLTRRHCHRPLLHYCRRRLVAHWTQTYFQVRAQIFNFNYSTAGSLLKSAQIKNFTNNSIVSCHAPSCPNSGELMVLRFFFYNAGSVTDILRLV